MFPIIPAIVAFVGGIVAGKVAKPTVRVVKRWATESPLERETRLFIEAEEALARRKESLAEAEEAEVPRRAKVKTKA